MPVACIDEDAAGIAYIADDPNLSKLALALKGVGVGRVKAAYLDQVKQGHTRRALLASAELAARGIPPCFRGIPTGLEGWARTTELDFILMAADIQWIVLAYPAHRTGWERAQDVFNPAKFGRVAAYLHWAGRRTPGQVVTALGLSERQQHECVWIQSLHMRQWTGRLSRRLPIAELKITEMVRATDKRDKAQQDATIKRRVNLWHCAELADWKPQRTADLYAMLTGETMPRNAVSNQLAKLPKVRRTDSVYPLCGLADE